MPTLQLTQDQYEGLMGILNSVSEGAMRAGMSEDAATLVATIPQGEKEPAPHVAHMVALIKADPAAEELEEQIREARWELLAEEIRDDPGDIASSGCIGIDHMSLGDLVEDVMDDMERYEGKTELDTMTLNRFMTYAVDGSLDD